MEQWLTYDDLIYAHFRAKKQHFCELISEAKIQYFIGLLGAALLNHILSYILWVLFAAQSTSGTSSVQIVFNSPGNADKDECHSDVHFGEAPSGRLQGVDYCTPERTELVDELGDDDGDEVELLSGGQSASRHTGRLVYSDHTTYAHISIK